MEVITTYVTISDGLSTVDIAWTDNLEAGTNVRVKTSNLAEAYAMIHLFLHIRGYNDLWYKSEVRYREGEWVFRLKDKEATDDPGWDATQSPLIPPHA